MATVVLDPFYREIEDVLGQIVGRDLRIESIHPVSGGCIHQGSCILLCDHSKFFIKQNQLNDDRIFEAEANGLRELAKTNTVSVPSPVVTGVWQDQAYLVMEWIESQSVVSKMAQIQCSQNLGRALAGLHHYRGAVVFGLDFDNFIGSSIQKNQPTAAWQDFFMQHRLEFQLRLADQNGYRDVVAMGRRTLTRIQSLLRTGVQPSLLHGDLWSGNVLTGVDGHPVFIDPAPYWGDREAEFGILTLFGGFDSVFFDAYQERLPLEEGFAERLPVYQLYHYLNHLNLFGYAYADAVRSLLAGLE